MVHVQPKCDNYEFFKNEKIYICVMYGECVKHRTKQFRLLSRYIQYHLFIYTFYKYIHTCIQYMYSGV